MSWVEVARLPSRQQAEGLAFTLATVGIEADVRLELETAESQSQSVPAFALLVDESQAEAARQIVAEELETPSKARLREAREGRQTWAASPSPVRGGLIFILGLMVLLVIVFVAEEIFGGSERHATLVRFGASFGPGVLAAGQWWRTVTAAFLHIGPQHLLANLGSLFVLGALSRDHFGPGRLGLLWLLSAVAGNWFSLALSSGPMLRAGASGGIFGLFGGLVGARLRQLHAPQPASRYKRWHVIATVLAFLALTVGTGPTDYPAHLGGLASGVLLGLLLSWPRRERLLELVSASLAGGLTLVAGLLALRG